MAARSFKVFLDTPSDTPQQKDTSPTSPTLSPSASISLTASISSILSPVTATDKENLDPVTGEPVHPTNTNVKKRKTSVVLSTKTLASLEPVLKDVKESAEGQPETKKRKASVSSGTKPKVKKDGKLLGSGKKATTKKLLRKPLTMPKVVEEVDVEREQALADSRCRDLTVSPLADVSEAYIESTVFGEAPVSEDTRWLSKESSCEPEIRDYLTTAHLSASTSSSSTLRGSSPACEPPKVFSTPERKRIYSAFTFQSPSPASERLHKLPNDTITLGPLNFGEFDDASS
ncbi:hypothetical protein AAF712_008591 [Marasmius tenuissimus]|uniref:Uncharacterized protein n=1 Tax=Marasmius tenuissimus TaxID=585030 RepID=A0ABR2ZRW9_9AGAR|nr:hypothetical protein PM082_007517 [Marasmius tenuissimus]